RSTRSASPNSLPTEATERNVAAMFNGEKRGLLTDEGRSSLAPMLIWLFNVYAGLSTAVAGLVLDEAVLVCVGFLLVVSGSMLAKLITMWTNRTESGQVDFYESGERCALSHPSPTPLTPSVKNSVSPSGPCRSGPYRRFCRHDWRPPMDPRRCRAGAAETLTAQPLPTVS
ncbi:MAG: hypothetical protein QOD39_937, partial [Mycobacterium sp.]|nr:hypothetical protein [Mycobacterium sp.]